MSKLPISICMIGKNEERFLEGCLEKLKPYGFEIVFTDTGSTDNTVEIAKKYADKVLHFPWIDDFSAARNYSADHASNDWVIALDCDEYLEPFDAEDLLELFEENKENIGVITVENIVRVNDGFGKSTQTVQRIYHRKNCRFFGLIHEQVRRMDASVADCFLTKIKILHYGYSLSAEETKKKNARNITLLEKEIQRNPQEPYYYFQLGQSYTAIDDYETTFQYLHHGLELSPDPNQEYVQHMLIDYGNAMLHTGRYQIALNMESVYDILKEYADYHFMMGKIYYANAKILKALEEFTKATTATKTIVFGTNTFFPLNSMALIYEKIGESELAQQCKARVEEIVSHIDI